MLFLKLSSHTSLHQLLWCLVRRTTDCYTRLPRCCTRTGQCNCCAHSPTSLRCPVRWLVHSRMVSHFLMRSVEIVTCWLYTRSVGLGLLMQASVCNVAPLPPMGRCVPHRSFLSRTHLYHLHIAQPCRPLNAQIYIECDDMSKTWNAATTPGINSSAHVLLHAPTSLFPEHLLPIPPGGFPPERVVSTPRFVKRFSL